MTDHIGASNHDGGNQQPCAVPCRLVHFPHAILALHNTARPPGSRIHSPLPMPAHYEIVPNDAPEDATDEKYERPPRPRFPRLVLVLFAVVVIQSIALVTVLSTKHSPPIPRLYCACHPPPITPHSEWWNLAPVQDFVKETITVYPLGFGHDLSEFQVPSSPELDDAWNDLYNCSSSPPYTGTA
jgi:hypothetical protein